jgi:hypothetical protein
MMRKYHVRFGGGRMEKEPQGHLVSRLPNTTKHVPQRATEHTGQASVGLATQHRSCPQPHFLL